MTDDERRRHIGDPEEQSIDRWDPLPLAADPSPDTTSEYGETWHLDGCPWLRPVCLEGGDAESDVPFCTCFELDGGGETLIPF